MREPKVWDHPGSEKNLKKSSRLPRCCVSDNGAVPRSRSVYQPDYRGVETVAVSGHRTRQYHRKRMQCLHALLQADLLVF